MELGGYQPRDPGTVWELGSHVAVRDLRDDQGAPASPQALDWSVTLPETVERLGSYRPSTPEFWSQNVPFSLTLSDVQGEVVVEVRAVTRLDAIP